MGFLPTSRRFLKFQDNTGYFAEASESQYHTAYRIHTYTFDPAQYSKALKFTSCIIITYLFAIEHPTTFMIELFPFALAQRVACSASRRAAFNNFRAADDAPPGGQRAMQILYFLCLQLQRHSERKILCLRNRNHRPALHPRPLVDREGESCKSPVSCLYVVSPPSVYLNLFTNR